MEQPKRALVGGSSKGIGLASAIALSKMGYSVCLMARNEKDLNKAIEQLDKQNNQMHSYLAVDVSDLEVLSQKVGDEIAKNGSFHVLVNNTGGPAAGPILYAKTAEFESAFKNHLLANHTLATLLIPGMKESGFGRIVNIISTSVKQPLPNLGVSNTIRAAVGNWAKTLANEVASYGITVNNVLPGATSTERLESIISTKSEKTQKSKEEISQEMLSEIPMKRFGRPEEIAAAVAFLASDAASYITGINIPVDGGRTGNL